jgi:5-oxoprolinase (ATP-hydrolysing)
VLLEEFAIRHGSGGTGRWHGGDGAVRRIKFRKPMTVSTLTSHRRVPPYGLADGSPGALGHNRVQRTDGTIVDMAGCDSVDLQPGDLLVIETPGGGRYDHP